MKEEIVRETAETAKTLIDALKGTAAGLKVALDQERDNNEGLELTCAKLQAEVDHLTEKAFQLEAENEAKQEEMASESAVPAELEAFRELSQELSDKLSFYYKDIKALSPKDLGAEDAARLYQILDYTYKTLKKAGIRL